MSGRLQVYYIIMQARACMLFPIPAAILIQPFSASFWVLPPSRGGCASLVHTQYSSAGQITTLRKSLQGTAILGTLLGLHWASPRLSEYEAERLETHLLIDRLAQSLARRGLCRPVGSQAGKAGGSCVLTSIVGNCPLTQAGLHQVSWFNRARSFLHSAQG